MVACMEQNTPSLVMNEMNSLTHSCMHSFASFAILAFSGNADFIIRATGAKFRMLASDCAWVSEELLLEPLLESAAGGDLRDMLDAFATG